ncbi:MAG: GntR family transcriptional regulator [Clostridia bacterium]|nr:GntR family transcriptional regulator [Clostridia bacterium]MBQ6676517.1 GntR family transcriptional regulator [Clostridia bacterium]MBR4661644.1 GntR family transcriptional regulator [Clostridia bacterium]
MNNWKFDPEKPLFRQICDRLCDEIARGVFPPGSKVPSVRELAVIAGVNPNTVQRALSELEDEGILVSRRGDGRYVADNGTLRDNMLLERSRTATLEFVRAMRDLGLDDPMIRESLEKALSAPSDTKGVDAASGTTVYS